MSEKIIYYALVKKKIKNFPNQNSLLLLFKKKKKKKQSKNFIYLSEKLISYAFVKNLKHFILDLHFRSVLRIWLCFCFYVSTY